jgi:putative oxidoreductase
MADGLLVTGLTVVGTLEQRLGRALDLLRSPVLFVLRGYVSWQFLHSGWLKLTTWDSTLYLFQEEYHVPLLSPQVAAVVGTFSELFWPALLLIGLWSRVSALGVFAVNAMAVLAYQQVLLAPGYEAAFAQHVLWGVISFVLLVFGPGSWTIDRLLTSRRRESMSS